MKKRFLSMLVLLAAVATGAMAQETYKVSVKEGTEDATSWTIAPAEATTTGVAAGTTVTATYSGTKKVKSVKAVKKVAPAATNLSTINANYTANDGETLTGTLGANVKISIADGATVTLDGVTINGTNKGSYEWAGITCLGDATIILSGTNTVRGFYEDYPGIQAAVGKTLTINGTGSLTASSNGYGAGIGGGSGVACGNIEIQGGTITATSVDYSAGIGGGDKASCGNITISGGTVTATGGYRAAGIGGGRRGMSDASCGNIIISGGTVTATGGEDAAGIGGGRGNSDTEKSSCGTITITTGVTKVTATMGDGATNSIGAGKYGTCGTVTIGGVVGAITESPFTYPASAEPEPAATDLSTINANYTASDGETLTGTLASNVKISIADGATVILNNVSINADGTWGDDEDDHAGITCVGDATIILKDGSENTVKGFYEDYPGIYVPTEKTLTIKGETLGTGSLTASSNGYGAGIGGGFGISCGNIEIQGGVITATGGSYAAGIGAGSGVIDAGSGVGTGESICGTITISGGTVTAIGGSYAAGIGSGYAQTNPSTCGAISISGGTVSAKAGALAPAAIGKGGVDTGESTCASVTINSDITSLTLTNSQGTGIVSDFINAEAVYADTNPITYMLPTSVTDPTITGGMDYYGFATSYNDGTKTWTITKK